MPARRIAVAQLDVLGHALVWADASSGIRSIELPRLELAFAATAEPWRFASNDFHGYVLAPVDPAPAPVAAS